MTKLPQLDEIRGIKDMKLKKVTQKKPKSQKGPSRKVWNDCVSPTHTIPLICKLLHTTIHKSIVQGFRIFCQFLISEHFLVLERYRFDNEQNTRGRTARWWLWWWWWLRFLYLGWGQRLNVETLLGFCGLDTFLLTCKTVKHISYLIIAISSRLLTKSPDTRLLWSTTIPHNVSTKPWVLLSNLSTSTNRIILVEFCR